MSPDELKQHMRKLGLFGQQELADAIGVNRTTVSLWLTGKIGVPRPICMLLRMLLAQSRRDYNAEKRVVIQKPKLAPYAGYCPHEVNGMKAQKEREPV